MTPETRDFLAFCSLAFKLQPVEQGVYHRGFISYGRVDQKREISTQAFCAIIRALRKTKPNTVYVDDVNQIRAYYDVRRNLHIGIIHERKTIYRTVLSIDMQIQLNMRQQKSGFRWIQRTKRGPKWISK